MSLSCSSYSCPCQQCPRQILPAQAGFEQSTSSWQTPRNEGQEQDKRPEMERGQSEGWKRKILSFPAPQVAARRANYPARLQSACEGLKSCSHIQHSRCPPAPPALPGPGPASLCQEQGTSFKGQQGQRQLWCSHILSMRDARTLSTRKG